MSREEREEAELAEMKKVRRADRASLSLDCSLLHRFFVSFLLVLVLVFIACLINHTTPHRRDSREGLRLVRLVPRQWCARVGFTYHRTPNCAFFASVGPVCSIPIKWIASSAEVAQGGMPSFQRCAIPEPTCRFLFFLSSLLWWPEEKKLAPPASTIRMSVCSSLVGEEPFFHSPSLENETVLLTCASSMCFSCCEPCYVMFCSTNSRPAPTMPTVSASAGSRACSGPSTATSS